MEKSKIINTINHFGSYFVINGNEWDNNYYIRIIELRIKIKDSLCRKYNQTT
jgi:hypothetical protein